MRFSAVEVSINAANVDHNVVLFLTFCLLTLSNDTDSSWQLFSRSSLAQNRTRLALLFIFCIVRGQSFVLAYQIA